MNAKDHLSQLRTIQHRKQNIILGELISLWFSCQRQMCYSQYFGSSTAKLRIWTLRIWGFAGPGFRCARQVLCGNASCSFLCHFSKHLSSVLGRTDLCHDVRNHGPPRPQIIRDEDHHLALLGKDAPRVSFR